MEAINNIEHLLEKARELKFKSIEPTIKALFKQARQESWSYEKDLDKLFTVEAGRKNQERKKSRIRRAHFRDLKYLQDIIMEELPENMHIVLPELETLDFIKAESYRIKGTKKDRERRKR